MLRVVLLLNAVGLNLYRADNFEHPGAGAIAVALMALWTGFAVWAYADPLWRRGALLAADLAVAVGLLVASPWVKGEEMRATIPGFWVSAALLGWAIRWHVRGGLAAGAVLAAADLSVRSEVGQANYGNIFLMLIGGVVVGFLSGSLQRMERERDAAVRAAAAGEERARLARAVHDGVLQVLALVQRRGGEAAATDPELARLGALAGEQEAALRSLIRQQDTVPDSGVDRDLAATLEGVVRRTPPRATLSTPGRAVELPASVVAELAAAVAACLDNVARHVGPEAPAWVLLEDEGERVVVTVRDEGPGVSADRLAEAEAEGRLGVAQSIVGRLTDLGGSAVLESGPSGTEWELVVPRLKEVRD